MVDGVGVGDQGVAHPGQVQQPVPGRVVAGEPGDLQRDDDADLAQRDLGDQVLNPSRRPVTDPETPWSASISRIALCGQPSPAARPVRSYWRRVDSVLRST